MIKYIILGNGNDWCELSFGDLKERNDIRFFNSKLPLDMNKLSSRIARYYFSNTINKRINLPFKHLWYPSLYSYMGLDASVEQVLIIYDKNMLAYNLAFLESIRKNYPRLKLVYAFTNIVKLSGAMLNGFVERLNDVYDVVLAFDPEDARKYSFDYSPLVYNADEKYMNHKTSRQVFYVGTAKDRLNELKAVYYRLEELDISYDFNIAEVPDNEVDHSLNITYNTRIPYSKVLELISTSDCLLDVIQGDSSGLTIKICEAVCYDKKLITTNAHVVEYPFYDERYVKIITNANDITKDFFENNANVHYSESDKAYFSTEAFLNRLDSFIVQKG